MNKKTIILIIIAILSIIMLFSNKKVSLVRILQQQLQIFRNDHTKRYSIWDMICFIVFPITISLLIVLGLSYNIDIELAEILTTVFSLVFTILFGFASVIVEKSEDNNSKKTRVACETFVSIVTSTALSLFAAIISIVLMKVRNGIAIQILSVVLLSISFIIVMLLLMITKRTFVIYCEKE